MTLGENLRLLRREKDLSQEQVAQTLFVTRQTISKWENDQAEPGIDNLKALAELYGVTLDRLVGAEPTEPSAEPAAASSISLRPPKTRSGPYLFWIALLVGVTVVNGLFTLENYNWVDIPISLIAMVVGIWVRHRVMWIVIQCIFTLCAVLGGIDLLLLGRYSPSIRRRFCMLERKPMKILGITGPTGAGKTTALKVIEQMGGAVIDCDAVYHELLESDIALQCKLEELFGPLQGADGAIDRKKLGTIVFGDPEKLELLNTVAQTATVERTRELLEEYQARGRELVAIDAIALLESGLKELCHATIAVIAPPEVRVRRIMAREGISEDYAWARVRAQRPDDYFVEGCDYTLWNDSEDPEEFVLQVKTLLETILSGQTKEV